MTRRTVIIIFSIFENCNYSCFVYSQGYYLATTRELTRLDSITKAPVIHHFSESITGVMTIRCFRKQEMFCQENVKRVNANLRMDFHNNGSNEWMGFRLELIGSFILCGCALFLILLPPSIIKPGNYPLKFLVLFFVLPDMVFIFSNNMQYLESNTNAMFGT